MSQGGGIWGEPAAGWFSRMVLGSVDSPEGCMSGGSILSGHICGFWGSLFSRWARPLSRSGCVLSLQSFGVAATWERLVSVDSGVVTWGWPFAKAKSYPSALLVTKLVTSSVWLSGDCGLMRLTPRVLLAESLRLYSSCCLPKLDPGRVQSREVDCLGSLLYEAENSPKWKQRAPKNAC